MMNAPKGYATQQAIRHRHVRPLHSRKTVFEAAEAVFKDKVYDEKQRLSNAENDNRIGDQTHFAMKTRRK